MEAVAGPSSGTSATSSKCIVCSIPCETTCAKCAKVSYCGKVHQTMHRREHRPNCFPAVEVKKKGLRGYYVASKPIAEGEIIFKETALVTGPTSFYKDVLEGVESANIRPICLGCCRLLNGTFKDWDIGCGDCSWPLCTQECKKKSNHSDFECKIFKDLKLTPSKLFYLGNLKFDFEMIIVLRMLLCKEKYPLKWDKIMEMESQLGNQKNNYDERLDSSMTILFLLQVCSLWDFCSLESRYPPRKLIHNIFVLLKINKTIMGIPNELYDVYEKSSKITHSCIPNTFALSYPTGVNVLRAKIKMAKGTILTEFYDVYSLSSMGVNERRQELYYHQFFWCQCSRCLDRTEADTNCSAIRCKSMLKGLRCSGFYLPVIKQRTAVYRQWQCNNPNCKSTKKYEGQLSKIYIKLEKEILAATTLEKKIEVINNNSNSTVHENHCLLINLRQKTMGFLFREFYHTPESDHPRRVELSQIMKEYGEKAKLVTNTFFAGRSPERGIMLYLLVNAMEMENELTPIDVPKANLLDCWKSIMDSKSIMSVLPTDHPAYPTYQEIETKDLIFKQGFSAFLAGLSAVEENGPIDQLRRLALDD